MSRAGRAFLAAAAALLLGPGCGTTEEAVQLPPPPPTIVQKEDTARVELRSRTDTVAIASRGEKTGPDADGSEPKIRFMVQIGAFKDARLATAVQTLARQRYRMPVLNDYIIQQQLYQIRIGFFETRVAAQAFRGKMVQDFPKDYADSWVVQLRR